MCLEIYEVDPEKFPAATRLAWQVALTLPIPGFSEFPRTRRVEGGGGGGLVGTHFFEP